MTTKEEKISKAVKIYNSCFNKFINILPWTDPITERILTAIELLKQVIYEYKIDKNIVLQIRYLLEIDRFYNEYFKHSSDKDELNYHVTILKDLITLCAKVNKEIYDIPGLIKKFIQQSEKTCNEKYIESGYKFIIEYYKNPVTNDQITLLEELYEKLHAIRDVYDEKYAELLINNKKNYVKGAEIY